MGNGADVYTQVRVASMTSKTDRKEHRTGLVSIKDGSLLGTGFLLGIVETGTWITRAPMTLKPSGSVYPVRSEVSDHVSSSNTYFKKKLLIPVCRLYLV